jgi:hypothetical protein
MMYKWTEDGTLFNATVFEYHMAEFRTDPDAWDYATAEDIAEELRGSVEWSTDLCEALCEEAGMLKEWRAADEDTYKSVVEAAAEKLGVELYY